MEHLAVASEHYHAGRFQLAAGSFQDVLSNGGGNIGIVAESSSTTSSSSSNEHDGGGGQGSSAHRGRKRKLPSESIDQDSPAFSAGQIFAALPLLSVEADAALSAARLAIIRNTSRVSSSSVGIASTAAKSDREQADEKSRTCDAVTAINSALEANSRYRKALLSASLALRRSEALDHNKNTSNKDNGYVTNRNRKQVAISFLMAGASASWLHLAISDVESAETALVESVTCAASCFWHDATGGGGVDNGGDAVDVLPPTMLPMTIGEAFHLTNRGLGRPEGNHTKSHDTVDDKRTVEMERSRHALRIFCNALRVVEVGGGNFDLVNTFEEKIVKESDKDGAEVEVEDDDEAGDTGLRSQELLTGALLAHKSLGTISSTKAPLDVQRKAIEKKRDELIAIAASLEASGGSSLGLARKVQVLLNGLQALSSSSQGSSSISHTVTTLKSLSSTSRTACMILGCIRAKRGELTLALDSWQKALELDEHLGTVGSRDHRETMLNMANCFALLGEATPAEELLLHLASDSSAIHEESSSKDDDTVKVAASLRITLYDGTCVPKQASDQKDEKRALLWLLFHMSTLAEDWATSLAAAEELVAAVYKDIVFDDKPSARAALIFALLQCHRPSLAMEKYVGWKELELTGALGALFELFEADALITTRRGFGNTSEPLEGVQKVSQKCEEATDKLESGFDDEDGGGGGSTDGELGIATDNNRGISLLLAGKVKEAFAAFEEASIERPTMSAGDMNWLLLRPRFNLALLLWRENHRNEAAKVWMGTRKLDPRTSNDGDYQTNDLRAALEQAISRHGLYCAKKKAPGGDAQARTGELIMPWRSYDGLSVNHTGGKGTRSLVGLDMEQALAFDVTVLQYAVSQYAKKESREFNTFGGNFRSSS